MRFTLTIQHQLDPKTRDLLARQIAGLLAADNAAALKRIETAMSALDDKISAIQGSVSGLSASINAVADELAKAQAAPPEASADQLAAMDNINASLVSAKAALDGLVPPAPAPEPAATEEPAVESAPAPAEDDPVA